MSQDQPRRPSNNTGGQARTEPIKYGDVFDVSGGLADQRVAPRDAAMMQSAENLSLGQSPKGGAAAAMQSAARRNENAGLVGHDELSPAAREGMTVTEMDAPGRRVVTESVGGQVVDHFETPVTAQPAVTDAFTIGDALEAAAVTARYKPVTHSDASAIQAAEVRATGRTGVVPGGVGAVAKSAANANDWTMDEDDKTTLGDVLEDAKARLPADKAVTAVDAERVTGAELRNSPDLVTYPGGVADTMTAAARLNRQAT
ncbi:Late embryogenesis abundant protein D-34 [Nymphaea thermarum]|nr:Late embryogenesis abundant protein D-34 [Nymphaea thermarum]